MTSPTPPPLPRDAVLLHVGPHKTGTTALQGAFHLGRDRLEALGVHYAGSRRQPMHAALAMSGRPGRRGDEPPQQKHWRTLTQDVAAATGKRVVVSSEFFADAVGEAIPEIIEGLGGDRVHVVVTLRPLAKLMPSQWQQYVQNGLRMRYEDWLDAMLNKPPYIKPTTTFWNRHRHAELVRRWADVAGPDRVTVIVLDESDRGMLLHTFEALLALPPDTLVPETGVANRSLTVGEVEVIRRLNEEFRRRGWNDDLYGRFVRNGVAKKLLAQHRPSPDEPKITTPKWALDRTAEIGATVAREVTEMGVRIIGDLGALSRIPSATDTDPGTPSDPVLPSSAAALAIIGTIVVSRKAQWPDAEEPAPAVGSPTSDPGLATVDEADSRTLAKVLTRRVARRARTTVRYRTRRR